VARPQQPPAQRLRGAEPAGSLLLNALAVFDFDGTITRADSLVDFARHVAPRARLYMCMPRLAFRALGFAAGRRDRTAFKEDVLTSLFAGWRAGDFDRAAEGYAAAYLPRLVRPAALDRLRWHRAQGHRVVIATASLEAYVTPWARRHGIGEVLGTKLEVDGSGRLTGRLEGRNCYGAEKVARLRALVGDIERDRMYAYGDSRGDRELLDLAAHRVFRPFRGPQLVSDGTS